MSVPTPTASIAVRERGEDAFFEALFRYRGKQLKRRIGPAWLERDEGRAGVRAAAECPTDAYDERRAHVAAAQLVSDYLAEAADVERVERERRTKAVTFREVAHAYLAWLEDVKGAKPSTMADYRYLLAEPGVPYKRGHGESAGYIMVSLGDLARAR